MNPNTIAITDLAVGMKVTIHRPEHNLLVTGIIRKVELENNFRGGVNVSVNLEGWGYSTVEISQDELVAVFPPEEE